MSNRYYVKVFDNGNKLVGDIQLFGNNEYVEELHEFAKRCGFDVDEDYCFKGSINGDQLKELYKTVDKVCLDINNDIPLHIDVTDLYNKYGSFYESLGECLVKIVDGQYRVLQSAMLLMFMWNSRGIDCWSPSSIYVRDGYKVVFSWR